MTEPTRPQPKTDHIWLYVGVAFATFWVVYLVWFTPRVDPIGPHLEGSGLAEPADYAWKLTDLDGKTVDFGDYKGKAIFLNIWATWCPPCVKELPSIGRLAANPNLKDVAFLCVATGESPATVKRFLAGKALPMTFLSAADLPKVFATEGIPATFLISPDGRIVASEIGGAEWDDPKVIALLESLTKKIGVGRTD